ncbi:MAG: GNAT family N-acetyltransferase [Pseudomonadales bacterium]|nr:GNAT family N-acetyltransferase [Pseudomonadales bacterium]
MASGDARGVRVRQANIEELHSLNAQIAEFKTPYPVEIFRERLARRDWLGLVAEDDGELLGFKLGYDHGDRVFYSWLGGVLPAARRRGAARRLLRAQESWVTDHGYREIWVKSRNRYRNMLMLLWSEGYQIFDIEPKAQLEDNRIWFRKSL